ncbi:MAG TPA: hypothetical protein VHL58_19370 [Thermoanaerobaculia bacterium]|nr:hypothetical protein [Thermoanaerobaculia bacterium]
MDEYLKAIRTPLVELFAISVLLSAPALLGQKPTTASSAPDIQVVAPATSAQTTTDTSVKTVTPTDSALVRAARQTKAGKSRKTKAKVSINNAAVKKSKGKLIEISSSNPQQPLPVITGDEVAKLKADQEQRQKSAQKANERLEKAKTDVADLEKELSRLEEQYYGSDDPTSRDQIIEPRFNKTKEQLAKAREALNAARDAADKGGSTSPAGH